MIGTNFPRKEKMKIKLELSVVPACRVRGISTKTESCLSKTGNVNRPSNQAQSSR